MYLDNIEQYLRTQILGQNVGFLLGAGSSYLEGSGHPLADQLWKQISSIIPEHERGEIQSKIDDGAVGIEQTLDLIDNGKVEENPHRYLVVQAIACHFCTIDPPLDNPRAFVSFLNKQEKTQSIRLFTLNYDPLIERAAEIEQVRVFDGFYGHAHASFNVGWFSGSESIIRLLCYICWKENYRIVFLSICWRCGIRCIVRISFSNV